ncbi:MAG: ATP-binding protein [Chloroflexota bacterium]
MARPTANPRTTDHAPRGARAKSPDDAQCPGDCAEAGGRDVAGGRDQTFGAILRRARRDAGMTQEALAKASGVAVRTISDLERGISSAPQGESGAWLADALGLAGPERASFLDVIREQRRLPGPRPLAVVPPPLLPGSTLGREAEIAAIEAVAAGEHRLVSLVGVGGIGKTRIATEIARRRAARPTRPSVPAAWTPLAALTDPAEVLPAAARALGLADLPAGRPPSQFAAALAGRPVLLVLDNMEHLLDAALAVADLIAAVPSIAVLVTSREALRITGERVIPVGPLAVPAPGVTEASGDLAGNPAVALFLRGHAEAAAGAPVTEPGLLDAAARIVRMVDGMPLAIELAAAQSGAMAPAGIADLLERSALAVLGAGRRDGPARFRTMEAALAWSADLLPEPAMRLLRLLGAFRGGFTTAAVAGVAAAYGDPGLVSALPALANNYLVRPNPADPGRHVMLEPVRMFAASLLEARGEADAARRAHADWFLAWASRYALDLAGAEPLPALDALEADLPNLQAALQSAMRLGMAVPALESIASLRRFWEYRSHFTLAMGLIDEALAIAGPDAVPLPTLLEAAFCRSYFAALSGDVAGARRTAGALHDLAARHGDADYDARAYVLDAIRALYMKEHPEEALPLARRALAVAAAAPGGYGEWAARLTLGGLLQEAGEAAEALPLLEAAVRAAAERGCALDQVVPLSRLGFTLLDLGRLDDAERRLGTAAAIAHDFKGLGLLIFAVLGLSRAAALRRDEAGLTRAMILAGAFRSLLERIGLGNEIYQFSPFWDAANTEQRAWADAALGPGQAEDLIALGRAMEPGDMLTLIRS